MTEFSQETEELIKRIEELNLRQEIIVNKERIIELVEEAYNLFNLKIPEIIWVDDITDMRFQKAAEAAGAARAAKAAEAAWAAWAAGAARAAKAAEAAWAAWAAGAAEAAGAAGAAGIDYDFDYFIFTFEYRKTNEINKNDEKFLKAQELFLQLKEAGLGYWVEHDEKLYAATNPIIQLDSKFRYHSTEKAAIKFSDNYQFFYIHGIRFEKELWEKVKEKRLTAKQILQLENIGQRYIALMLYEPKRLLEELDAKLISKTKRNELYSIGSILRNKDLKLLKYLCPSTNREYVKFVPDNFIDADEAQAWSFQIKKEEYEILEVET